MQLFKFWIFCCFFAIAARADEICNTVHVFNVTDSTIRYLASDGYPDMVDPGSDCQWIVKVRPGFIIRFDIRVGAIGDYWLDYNYLSLWDVVGRLHTFSNLESHKNYTFFTSSSEGTIKFATRDTEELVGYPKGWSVLFREVPVDSSDFIHAIRDSTNGTIQTSAYPDFYSPNNFRQAWRITVDPGSIVRLSLSIASMSGAVTVYDGPSSENNQLLQVRFSNYETELFTSSNEAFVMLESSPSDLSYGYPHGFKVHYEQVTAPAVRPCRTIRELAAFESGSFGTITSDYYHSGSGNKADGDSQCGWLIKSEIGTKIGFAFADVTLASVNGSCWGNITIYDGDTLSSPVVIQKCTKATSNTRFYSTSNTALVLFESSSDDLTEFDGLLSPKFVLNYWQELAAPTCQSVTELNAQTGMIKSSGYPYRYDANNDCTWNITVDTGYVIKFRVSIGNIFQGYGYQDCENAARYSEPRLTIFSPSSSASSDALNFTLCYSYFEATYTTPSNVASVSFYPGGSKYLNYYNSHFIANYFQYPLGFTLSYEQVLPDKVTPCREVRKINLSTTAVTAPITNDYYPQWYEADSDCQWLITAPPGLIIQFFLQNIKLLETDNCTESFSIYDGDSVRSDKSLEMFCGTCISNWDAEFMEYYTTSNVGLVHFKTAAAAGGKHDGYFGFKLIYKAVAPFSNAACRKVHEIDLSQQGSSLSGVIESDGYPNSYDAYSRCGWRIIAPQNHRLDFNTSIGEFGGSRYEDRGFFQVTEGFTCGKLLVKARSGDTYLANRTFSTDVNGNVAVVHFSTSMKLSQLTPSLLKSIGFRLEYKAIPSDTTPEPITPPSSGDDLLWLWILLGVFGGLILTVAGCFGIFRLTSAKENAKASATADDTSPPTTTAADASIEVAEEQF